MKIQEKTSYAHFWVGLVLVTLTQPGYINAAIGGENYVGIGYNLLTANPDGGSAAGGGVDPGLLITRRILDLSDRPRAVVSQVRHSCGDVASTHMFYGAKSYQDRLSVGVNLGGGLTAGLVSAKFTLSPRFLREKNETNLEHKVFQDEQLVCNLGRIRFADELSDWLNVSVTDSFASSVCQLPQSYTQQTYMDFLDHWGTHMTTEVDIGTKVIHRSQASMAEFVQHVIKSSGADVSLGGSYMGFGASLGVNVDSFKASSSFSQSFGSHHETLTVGSTDLPEPIRVALVPVDTALQSKYWDSSLATFVSRGLCAASWRTEAIAANLRQALAEYATYKMTQPPTDPQLIVPLTWPRGTYGVMKAETGCPEGRVHWSEGWRYQDSGLHGRHDHQVSPGLHLAGSWEPDGNIRMDFCVKGTAMLSEFDVSWPAGDYCLLKYGACPDGFQEGFVQWDDVGHKNAVGGTLPDGVYDDNTKIMFCCRNDSVPTTGVYLPVERPFYLLRHQRGCQHVQHMAVREESVRWAEAFDFFFFGFDSDERIGGSHPLDDGDKNHHRLHFCYYYPDDSGAGSLLGHNGHGGAVIGSWEPDGNIRMDFCVKGTAMLSEFDVSWPAGDYCLLKYGACPDGFQEGFVQWDDVGHKNAVGGTLPDGVYDDNTKIMFCCRNDSVPTTGVYLPVERPFYLLRHQRGCQHVQHMAVREESVRWAEAFDFFFFGFDSDERIGGSHPLDDGDKNHHRLHFCYYYPDDSGAGSLLGHNGHGGAVIG